MMNLNIQLVTDFLKEQRGYAALLAPRNFFFGALMLAFMLMLSNDISAQDTHLEFRFKNGIYNSSFNTYSIDVEVKSSVEDAALYAMNLRFFYEADELSLHSYSNFKKGYGLINSQKKSLTGAPKSASKMFGLTGAAGYINQGIEMKNVASAEWKYKEWERVTTLHFDVLSKSFESRPCPSFVWDKQREMDQGGLLRGSMGNTATFIGTNGEEIKCQSALCDYEDFSWKMSNNAPPYGYAQKEACLEQFEIAELPSTPRIVEEFAVSQNSPNPFIEETTIEFEMPKGEEVKFSVFDLKGVLLYSNTRVYDAGFHRLIVGKEMNLPSGTLMYQFETGDHQSEIRKMVKID